LLDALALVESPNHGEQRLVILMSDGSHNFIQSSQQQTLAAHTEDPRNRAARNTTYVV
jgi:hypothetical protein